ncbi:MAG: lipopolysaccharide heptosyltransferase II [Chloroflexota bacterium]|nr:lipopolysaccharide heptosyltransferase II [Chloroflexota bacterium]
MPFALRDAMVSLACRPLGIPFRLLHRPSSLATPHSILIIKPCCIGDVLLATPVVAALRRAFPEVRLDFAVGPWSRAMVENNPHLDGIVDCGRVGSGPCSWREYLHLVRRIRARRYDACFVLDRSPLITLLPFLAGIPQRIGLDSQGRGFSLTVKVPVAGTKHEAELYLDALRAVGIEIREPKLEFYSTEEDRHYARNLLEEQQAGSRERIVVVIHPGGGVNPGMSISAKRWPPERFARLADRLIKEGVQVVLVGGPGDKSISEAVKGAMHGRVLDLTGELSWGQFGALLEEANLFIGHDTGAMHLAVAVGTPVVAIFGPSDPRMYGPCGKGVALWHDVGCNPCFVRGRWREDCHEFRCIEAVTVEEVLEAALALLNS